MAVLRYAMPLCLILVSLVAAVPSASAVTVCVQVDDLCLPYVSTDDGEIRACAWQQPEGEAFCSGIDNEPSVFVLCSGSAGNYYVCLLYP